MHGYLAGWAVGAVFAFGAATGHRIQAQRDVQLPPGQGLSAARSAEVKGMEATLSR